MEQVVTSSILQTDNWLLKNSLYLYQLRVHFECCYVTDKLKLITTDMNEKTSTSGQFKKKNDYYGMCQKHYIKTGTNQNFSQTIQ